MHMHVTKSKWSE